MKTACSGMVSVLALGFLLLFVPTVTLAQQPSQASPGAPPVGPPVVREGDFAVSLAQALGLGTPENEVAAESQLGGMGITPRNGWIADYPMTPDVAGKVQEAIKNAADTRMGG